MNVYPFTTEATYEYVLVNLIAVIRNLRKNTATDITSKNIMKTANEIKRTSYMAQLEYMFILALNYTQYSTSETS